MLVARENQPKFAELPFENLYGLKCKAENTIVTKIQIIGYPTTSGHVRPLPVLYPTTSGHVRPLPVLYPTTSGDVRPLPALWPTTSGHVRPLPVLYPTTSGQVTASGTLSDHFRYSNDHL